MKITWNDLTFLPSDAALASLREAWDWFLPATFEPVMASTLGADKADEWFLPDLVEALKVAGKNLHADQCYTYVTLPIFAEGKYEVGNLNPVPAAEHFSITGDLHRQLRDLPDGATVRIVVED